MALSGCQKNRKWAHTVLRTVEPWFSRIDILRNFKPSKCSQEAARITPQQISHFQAYKMQERRSQPLVLRNIRYLILKSPKCRQRAHTTFTLGRNSIFRPPKCIKWTTRKYVPLNRRFHDSPKIEIIRLPKCKKWARECHVPKKRGFYDPPKIAPCVSWIRRNRIFRTPKCRKWTHIKVCSIKPCISRLGKIAFSGLKNEENVLKLREVPLNSGLHDSAKIAFPWHQNAENELTRKYVPLNHLFNESAEIAFSGRQSAEHKPWVSRFGRK